jgi:hypothetical protein
MHYRAARATSSGGNTRPAAALKDHKQDMTLHRKHPCKNLKKNRVYLA